jgi:hypothetical protein
MRQVEPAAPYDLQDVARPQAGENELAVLREENRQLRELVVRLSSIAIRNAIERK